MVFLGNAALNLVRWRREENPDFWHPLWVMSPLSSQVQKAPSGYNQMHPAVITSLFAALSHSHVLQKCLLQGQRTPAEPGKLLSDSRHLAEAEVHSLQTWEAQTEKKYTFADTCKPCTAIFWPVNLGSNCSYIRHVLGRVSLLNSGLARKRLLHSQGSEAKASATTWDFHQ